MTTKQEVGSGFEWDSKHFMTQAKDISRELKAYLNAQASVGWELHTLKIARLSLEWEALIIMKRCLLPDLDDVSIPASAPTEEAVAPLQDD